MKFVTCIGSLKVRDFYSTDFLYCLSMLYSIDFCFYLNTSFFLSQI